METSVLAERLSALDSPGDGAEQTPTGGGCEPEKLTELVAIAERLHTMIAAETVRFDATGASTGNGYRSPAGFLAGDGARIGRDSARRYLRCGRILAQFPLLAAAAEAGEITFDHVAVFARLLQASASDHRRACVIRDEAKLVAAARRESATGFSGWCVSWRHEVDPDDRLEERLGREDHGLRVNQLDGGSSELTLRGTSGEIEQLRSAINQLADEAWRAERDAPEDSDAGQNEPGVRNEPDLACEGGRPRGVDENEPSSENDGNGSCEERYATGTGPRIDASAPSFRCETIDGHAVPPEEALAVQIRDETCVHPACDLPATWADIDHIVDWLFHGRTDTDNGQTLCRYHHVEKHRHGAAHRSANDRRAA